jgi:hypothetical protein
MSRSAGGIFTAVAVCMLWASTTVWGAKKEEEIMTRPPMPRDTSAMAYLGSAIEIPLEVRGRVVEPLKILIRKKPDKGRLGEVRMLPNGRGGMVSYTPYDEAKPGVDSFSFAAQSIDSPVSAPARVDIALRLRPARITHSREVDFGAVPLGGSAVSDVPISNSGADTAVLEPRVQEPWVIETASPFTLEGGRTESVRLRLKPLKAGDFLERVDLGGEWGGFSVRGSAFVPLEWDSKGLVFSSENRSRARSAVLFKNLSGEVRKVEFEWPEFLSGPPEVLVEPGGQTALEVKLNAKPSFTHKGQIQFRSGGFLSTFPVRVEAEAARVSIEPDTVLDLGEVAIGEPAKGKFTLRNNGGNGARVSVKEAEGIFLKPASRSFLLEPESSADLEVEAVSEKPGMFSYLIRFEWNEIDYLEAKVVLRVRAAESSARFLAAVKPAAEKNEQMKEVPSAKIAAVTGIEVIESRPRSITLSWAASQGAKKFLLESRSIHPNENGSFTEEWSAWQRNISYSIEGDRVVAVLRKLPSDTSWMVRVRGLDNEGKKGPSSKVQKIATAPETLFRIPFIVWGPVALIVAMFAVGFLLARSGLVQVGQG